MAKRKASRATTRARSAKKTTPRAGSSRRPAEKRTRRGSASKAKRTARKAKASAKTARKRPQAAVRAREARPKTAAKPAKVPRLDRARRILDDDDTVLATPPSSLDMNRHGSAARTGRAELDQDRREHRTMTPEITGGDADVDVENAYFSGEEAPGGDNPTPDQDVVDDIGKALGVEYADNEELKASDKVSARDKHRWELDPASAEDYKERD
jgi:hypothetical protein